MTDMYINQLSEIQNSKAADAAKNVKSDVDKDAVGRHGSSHHIVKKTRILKSPLASSFKFLVGIVKFWKEHHNQDMLLKSHV